MPGCVYDTVLYMQDRSCCLKHTWLNLQCCAAHLGLCLNFRQHGVQTLCDEVNLFVVNVEPRSKTKGVLATMDHVEAVEAQLALYRHHRQGWIKVKSNEQSYLHHERTPLVHETLSVIKKPIKHAYSKKKKTQKTVVQKE